MQMLVSNLLSTFGESIDQLAWMGPVTKQAAHEKLAKFTVKIGYPDKWQPKPDVAIQRDDLIRPLSVPCWRAARQRLWPATKAGEAVRI